MKDDKPATFTVQFTLPELWTMLDALATANDVELREGEKTPRQQVRTWLAERLLRHLQEAGHFHPGGQAPKK
jgi:hypothetical protein